MVNSVHILRQAQDERTGALFHAKKFLISKIELSISNYA